MTLVTVPVVVRTDIGDLLVIRSALHIVKNQSVTTKLGTVSTASLVIWETHVIHSVRITPKNVSLKKSKDILPSSDAFFQIPFYSILKNMYVYSFTIYFSIVSVFVLEITTNWLYNV